MLSCARVSTRPVVYSYMHLQLAGESKGAATFTEVALSLYGPRVSLFDRYMIRFHALKYTRLATLHSTSMLGPITPRHTCMVCGDYAPV